MKNQDMYKSFVDEIMDMYSAENQIIETLPKLIKIASMSELKEALSSHLKDTEKQSKRLETILSMLEEPVKEKKCKGMEGILKEGDEMVKNHSKSPILDAIIISAAQKVEHYEIASYGTLRSFAKHLGLNKQIVKLIQDTLDEEGQADKKLTKLAEGSVFSTGINQMAVESKR